MLCRCDSTMITPLWLLLLKTNDKEVFSVDTTADFQTKLKIQNGTFIVMVVPLTDFLT